MAVAVHAEAPARRPKAVLHDVLIVIAGNVLCLALVTLSTFVLMHTSAAGRLMREYAAAGNDPAAQAAVLARYEDPFATVMSFFDGWLLLESGVTAGVVGALVGALVWHRAFWLPILAVLPLAASPLLSPSSPTAWFRAAGWSAIAWAAATLVRRWRRGPRGNSRER